MASKTGTSVARLGQGLEVLDKPTDQAYQWARVITDQQPKGAPDPEGWRTAGVSGGEPAASQGRGLNRRVTWGGSQLRPRFNSPTVSTSGAGISTLARFNKATSARLIILAMGVGGAFIIVGGKNFRPYKSTVVAANGEAKDVQVPGTLHAFTGLVIAGTIALVVNEVSPEVGIVFAVGLIFLAWNNVQAYEALGNVLLGKGVKQPPLTTDQILGMVPGGSVVPQSDGSQLVKPKNGKPYILRPLPNGQYSQEPVPQGNVVT